MKTRLGLVCRMDHTGLGYQTRALTQMFKPDKVLLIDSTPFKETTQHPEWYAGYNIIHSNGIPGFKEYEEFLTDIDVMITAETPYVYEAWNWARLKGVKTFCQPNWELFDGLIQPNMPHPDQYLMPSRWHLEDMQKLFPNTIYLPPPIILEDFAEARKTNLSRTGKRRFVHIVGSNAIYDRNGWALLREALAYTNMDFELVVYSQQELTGVVDERVKYHVFDIENQTDLYTNFDALILPRRYGGLCLPMNEALASGLPVIMSSISPNKEILSPEGWRLPAIITDSFEGRSKIEVYSVSPQDLGEKITNLCLKTDYRLRDEKQKAYKIAYDNFSPNVLLSKYEELLK